MASIQWFSSDKNEPAEKEHYAKLSLCPLLLWYWRYHPCNLGFSCSKKHLVGVRAVSTFFGEKIFLFSVTCSKEFLHKKISRLAELFAYIAWSIWHNRNAQRVGTTTLPLRKIYSDAVDRLQEFQMTQDSSLLQRTVAQPTHWLPPPPSQFKANCDGAIFQDTSSIGLGLRGWSSIGMHWLTTHCGGLGSIGL